MERLAGCSLREVINQLPLDQVQQIVRSIAVYLKRIHAIKMPRFGALRHDGSLEVEDMITLRQRSPMTFAGPFDSVREYYAAFAEARWQNLQISQLKREAALLYQFIRDRLDLLAGQAGANLVTGDFQPSNIFVEGVTVTGIIDCEWAHAGCGEAEWFVARQRLLAVIDDPIRCATCAQEFDAQCNIMDPVQYRERCMLYEADDCLNSIEAFPWLTQSMDAHGAQQLEESIRARTSALERACAADNSSFGPFLDQYSEHMCGFIGSKQPQSNATIKRRGPDKTVILTIQGYTFIHNLLSITGAFTPQPFTDGNIVCLYNGEIYNQPYQTSDGEVLIPLYKRYGEEFVRLLDGEFAIALFDFDSATAIYSTDAFRTKPIWRNEYGVASYKSGIGKLQAHPLILIPPLSITSRRAKRKSRQYMISIFHIRIRTIMTIGSPLLSAQ